MAVQDGFSDPGITNNSKIRFFFSKKRYFPGNFIFHPVLIKQRWLGRFGSLPINGESYRMYTSW